MRANPVVVLPPTLDQNLRLQQRVEYLSTEKFITQLLRAVAQSHEGNAGVYGAVLVEGTVRDGDVVELLN